MFLTDDKGFRDFAYKERESEAAKQGYTYGLMNILSKAAKIVTKDTEKKSIFKQMTQADHELSNYEQNFKSLAQRLSTYHDKVINFLELKKDNKNNMIFFMKKMRDIRKQFKMRGSDIMNRKYYCGKSKKVSTFSNCVFSPFNF